MMKTKLIRSAVYAALLMLILLPVLKLPASAETYAADHTDPETGYSVYIIDDCGLLDAEEKIMLTEQMKPITRYGDIIFWSTDKSTFDEIEQAKEKRSEICGSGSSGIFAVNMSIKMVTFQSDGAIFSMVSSSKARSITDNVSHYASEGDYYSCASEAFAQVYEVLQGNAIAEPMKYISYTVIGLMLAFVLVVSVIFGTKLNPLVRKNKEKVYLVGSGRMFAGMPLIRKTGSHQRAWVTILWILLQSLLRSGGGSSGGSSGGRSSGGGSSGGGGGSSRF